MFGSPKMFCQCPAHKGPQEVSKDSCGTFNIFLCLGYVNLSHRKSSPTKTCQENNQNLSGKKFSASCLDLQRCFVSFMPTMVLRRSQRTLVGTFNVFLCLGHVNLSHRKSSPTKTSQLNSSPPHVWISKDVLPVPCPQRS